MRATARRLGRLLETLSGDIEEPTVKGASEAAVFESAETQVGAAMRTVPLQKSVPALLVSEADEPLSHQRHRNEWTVVAELVNERCRLPVAPHQIAGGTARQDIDEQLVLLLSDHQPSLY